MYCYTAGPQNSNETIKHVRTLDKTSSEENTFLAATVVMPISLQSELGSGSAGVDNEANRSC